jgi:LuxR family maltose regulon positive regulatory protein
MTAMISDCPSAAHPNGKQPARPGGQGASRQIRGIRPRRRPAQAGHPATAAPTPLLDGLGPTRVWVAAAFLLGVIAREVLGGPEAAGRALQHALELAEPDQVPVPSLRHPPPGQRGRHHQHPSTDESRIGSAAGLPAGADRPTTPPPAPAPHLQALTHGETRVLRYLPTNLSAREIADQLYLPVNTVKTHQRHLYQKLGTRTRTQAVQQARALGLFAAYSRRR